MYDNRRSKWLVPDNKGNAPDRCYRLMDLEYLTNTVMLALQQIYLQLGKGLPDCVYQLKLHNDLIKRGFQLQEEPLMLDHCTKNKPVRSQDIVNEMLVIEYIRAGSVTDHNKKSMTYDLESNYDADGLSMAGEMKSISISEVKQSNTYH